jgi:hypothetical protein
MSTKLFKAQKFPRRKQVEVHFAALRALTERKNASLCDESLLTMLAIEKCRSHQKPSEATAKGSLQAKTSCAFARAKSIGKLPGSEAVRRYKKNNRLKLNSKFIQ